jgi:tetratricopeptide (TPR) repeat protein
VAWGVNAEVKMGKIILVFGFLIILIFASIVCASCDKEGTEAYVRYGTQAEEAGRWGGAEYNYGGAALCYESNHDYDNAIKYELKSIEMRKKVGMLYGVSYSLIAHRYSKKGPGFEKEIRENCNLAEEELLKEINEELDSKNYGGVVLDYRSLANCFHLINDTEKTCKYCNKANGYSTEESTGLIDCVVHYGCPKSSDSTPINTGSSVGNGGGFPVIPIVGGLIVIVLIVVAFFLLKGRRRKVK